MYEIEFEQPCISVAAPAICRRDVRSKFKRICGSVSQGGVKIRAPNLCLKLDNFQLSLTRASHPRVKTLNRVQHQTYFLTVMMRKLTRVRVYQILGAIRRFWIRTYMLDTFLLHRQFALNANNLENILYPPN